jgi:hypothetical protein
MPEGTFKIGPRTKEILGREPENRPKKAKMKRTTLYLTEKPYSDFQAWCNKRGTTPSEFFDSMIMDILDSSQK